LAVYSRSSDDRAVKRLIAKRNNAPLIEADFIDLSKIYSISKFRSAAGHDLSQGSGESCRSMQHFYNPQQTRERQQAWVNNPAKAMQPSSDSEIELFSPVNGTINKIEDDRGSVGKLVYIQPIKEPKISLRLSHVFLPEDIQVGRQVTAGQKIGAIGQYSTTDIVITYQGRKKNPIISYFEVMPDRIFAKYHERGLKSRDDVIIPKAYRDKNPLQCNGEVFVQRADSNPEAGNYAYLSGYVQLKLDSSTDKK